MSKNQPRNPVFEAFDHAWSELFTSPAHLDTILSKSPKHLKNLLAQLIPAILLRPVSLADAFDIERREAEPWNLTPGRLSRWRPAWVMAEYLHASLSSGGVSPEPRPEDFPPAMLEEWERHWGAEGAARLVSALGRPAPLTLRARREVGATGLMEALRKQEKVPVKLTLAPVSPLGVSLASYAPVLNTALFEKGAFEIQDEGSQIMAFFALWPEIFGKFLSVAPGLAPQAEKVASLPELRGAPVVVDACAGAGGKSLAIGDALGGRGRIFAYDISDRKLQALKRRARHAELRNIQTMALEEGNEQPSLEKFRESADIVLVDAPCSGWGVLRRNPDIKWRSNPETLQRMPEIQKHLLDLYSELVKPGGRLVFGVCTFRPEETREVVKAFLDAHPRFEAREGGYFGPGSSDGFFMQALQRV